MKLLCLTSLMWVRNVIVAFRKKRNTVGYTTLASTFASVNLWRKYDFLSLRRKCDVIIARCTLCIYVYEAYKRNMINQLKINAILAYSFYKMSSCEILNWKIWHISFHLVVFNTQNRILR